MRKIKSPAIPLKAIFPFTFADQELPIGIFDFYYIATFIKLIFSAMTFSVCFGN